jgi:hypothetical protein
MIINELVLLWARVKFAFPNKDDSKFKTRKDFMSLDMKFLE